MTSPPQGLRQGLSEVDEARELGKSIQGRDLWMITINNPATGPDLSKTRDVHRRQHPRQRGAGRRGRPLYTVDYLLKNYGRADAGDRDDGPLGFLHPPHGQSRRPRPVVPGPVQRRFPRHRHDAGRRRSRRPVRRGRPGRHGRRRLHHHHAQEGAAGPGHPQARSQGLAPAGARPARRARATTSSSARKVFDNDGDGLVNEDPIGYVDPNRTWGYSWEPEYVQSGAGKYPFSIPETRSIALWALQHSNIAAVQSYHNNGQMILRGPGAKADPGLSGAGSQGV